MKQEMNDNITEYLGGKLTLNKIIIMTCQCKDFLTE